MIWWMVTPQNPLKRGQDIPDFVTRLHWSQEITTHPHILITDIEKQLGTYRSIDTVRALKRRFPLTRFVFFGGTEHVHSFHHWESWRELLQVMPFVFIARPPALDLVRGSPLTLSHYKNLKILKDTKLNSLSSTVIRNNII
jgi:nicotinate-nucleotide adenylyltransferase